MDARQHFERADELAEHANAAFTAPDQSDDDARFLVQLAAVHADLAHVAVITGWGRRSRPVTGTRPFEGIPTT